MIDIQLPELNRFIAKCNSPLLREPLRTFFTRSAIRVQGKARERAPVDTGLMRNEIVYEVDPGSLPLYAKVGLLNAAQGSPLWFKGRAMEFGTGSAGDSSVSHKSVHWPPAAALDTWAQRHGVIGGGFVIARAIARRGGLVARKFLRGGLQDSVAEIRNDIQMLGRELQGLWGRL